MSFKFTKHNDDQIDNKHLNYIAGQFAFFDIGEVYNDPKGPIDILLFHLLQRRIL